MQRENAQRENTQHTEEPWLIAIPHINFPRDDRLIYAKPGIHIAGIHIAEVFEYQNPENPHGPAPANAQRIIDCVNGCS